jgi:urease alpha subunit
LSIEGNHEGIAMSRVTRRGFLGSSLVAPLGLSVASQGVRAETAFGDADIVVTGGRVLTMDWYEPVAEAIAVRGSHIVAVGSNADILNLAGSSTVRIDARGMTVTPGFIDAHSHPLFAEEAVGVNVNLPRIAWT